LIRPCKICGKIVDFDDPWCEHETMEESAWREMPAFQVSAGQKIQVQQSRWAGEYTIISATMRNEANGKEESKETIRPEQAH
jgi:hypothetical protein